jgi:hypothetical protein
MKMRSLTPQQSAGKALAVAVQTTERVRRGSVRVPFMEATVKATSQIKMNTKKGE